MPAKSSRRPARPWPTSTRRSDREAPPASPPGGPLAWGCSVLALQRYFLGRRTSCPPQCHSLAGRLRTWAERCPAVPRGFAVARARPPEAREALAPRTQGRWGPPPPPPTLLQSREDPRAPHTRASAAHRGPREFLPPARIQDPQRRLSFHRRTALEPGASRSRRKHPGGQLRTESIPFCRRGQEAPSQCKVQEKECSSLLYAGRDVPFRSSARAYLGGFPPPSPPYIAVRPAGSS